MWWKKAKSFCTPGTQNKRTSRWQHWHFRRIWDDLFYFVHFFSFDFRLDLVMEKQGVRVRWTAPPKEISKCAKSSLFRTYGDTTGKSMQVWQLMEMFMNCFRPKPACFYSNRLDFMFMRLICFYSYLYICCFIYLPVILELPVKLVSNSSRMRAGASNRQLGVTPTSMRVKIASRPREPLWNLDPPSHPCTRWHKPRAPSKWHMWLFLGMDNTPGPSWHDPNLLDPAWP